ncbi:MAG: M56 family metallopeptidase [Gemmatimonadota bacterium]
MSEAWRIAAETALYNSAAWLLTYLIHSTVLLGVAALLTRNERLSPAWESLIWRSALVGGVISATGQMVLAELVTELQPLAAVTLTGGLGRTAVILAGVLSIAALIAMLRLRTAWSEHQKVIGARRPVGEWARRDLAVVRRSTRYPSAVALTESPTLPSPIAIGFGEICIPASGFEELSPAERRSVLAHELAHLAHRDQRWLILSQVIERALFFQPLNKLARRRLRECAEYLADDYAVGHMGNGVALAGALTRLAGRMPTALWPRSPAFAEPSLLLRRGRRILSGTPAGARPSAQIRLLIAGAVLAFALLIPGAQPPCNCRFLDRPQPESVPILAPAPEATVSE